MAGKYNFGQETIIRIGFDTAVDVARKDLYSSAIAQVEAIDKTREYDNPEYNFTAINGKLLTGVVTLRDGKQSLTLENCMFDTSNTKNIVRTAISGMNGTIKEWVSNGDTIITLTINILDKDDNYPLAQLQELKRFLSLNKELIINEEHINKVLDITRVVVTGWRHTPRTWSSFQTVIVDLISDEQFLIEEQILN